ncbi:phage tail protein [Limosilactobacillus reuteri]|uniref:phage tail protein n=1 Tax=Limosilactobacillus reuteri TaxID=1598 RepID=UPI00128CBE52|nr:phage tail protein [Limosilactobacillus reuteri]MQB96198.1 glycoside hydrolase [Limosilactobacillus reuteri]
MNIDEKVKVRGVGRTETEPLNCIDPDSFYVDWEANSAWSIQFTAHDDKSFAYSMLDAQASLFFDGQEYIIKQAEPDASGKVNTIDVVATHVYFELSRIRKYKTYIDPVDADKQTDVKVYGSTQNDNNNSGDDSGDDDDSNAQKTVTSTTQGNTTTKTTVTKTDETKEDSDENQVEYHIEDVLKHWIDGNQLGFSYQVIGDFPTAQLEELADGSGTDMLSKITEAWPNAIVYPDNKNIRVYAQDQFYKDYGNRLDYEYNTTEFKWTFDSTSLTNEVMCIGGKYSIETQVDTSTSGDDSHGSGGAGADKVVNDAKKYLGIPYVWGGHNKSNPQAGMDCSGFVSQVYYDFGINLPVNTVAMEPYFHEIPREQIQTGDVGFYGPHGGTYHICLILNKSTDIYEPQPGQSCMTQNIDAFPPHWYARNDQMASIVAGDSDSGGDTTSESSSSTSSEFYYFAPFMYRDEESIKKYGEYPAEPYEDGRFSDKNAMIEAAKTKVQPDPALSVEVTTYSSFKPVAGDMIHIMVKEQSICTNEAVVGFNWYPYSATNPTSVTLNSNSQNILDYQHSRQVALSDAIEAVKKESIGAANQVNQVGGDKQLFTWLKEYAG